MSRSWALDFLGFLGFWCLICPSWLKQIYLTWLLIRFHFNICVHKPQLLLCLRLRESSQSSEKGPTKGRSSYCGGFFNIRAWIYRSLAQAHTFSENCIFYPFLNLVLIVRPWPSYHDNLKAIIFKVRPFYHVDFFFKLRSNFYCHY